jgi:hypothetical protein
MIKFQRYLEMAVKINSRKEIKSVETLSYSLFGLMNHFLDNVYADRIGKEKNHIRVYTIRKLSKRVEREITKFGNFHPEYDFNINIETQGNDVQMDVIISPAE